MRRIFEVSTTGFDENLQLVGGDPYRTSTSLGLRVPTKATGLLANPLDSRYLFSLAGFSVSDGADARIIGYRQFASIGYKIPGGEVSPPPRIVEQEIESPNWHFVDGDISWHIRALGPPGSQGQPPNTPAPFFAQSLAWRHSNATPAMLYENIVTPSALYVDLTQYMPPKKGRPWGKAPKDGRQSTFYDLRTPWRTHGAWTSLDIPVKGPETIVFFASVRQTNPSGRTAITPPSPLYGAGLGSEEQFLLNFPNAIYWRVAGSLIVEVT